MLEEPSTASQETSGPDLKALIADLWINGEGPFRASGHSTSELLTSIGHDPVYFRENGNLITDVVWIQNHDGPVTHQAYQARRQTRGEDYLTPGQKRAQEKLQKWMDASG